MHALQPDYLALSFGINYYNPESDFLMRTRILFLHLVLAMLTFPAWAQVEGISIVSAENYFQDKDYRNALAGFEDYLLNIKFDRNIAYRAGISACRLGIEKRAVSHLQSARDAGVKDNYFSYWMGRSFLQDNQWDSATIYLEQYLDVFPVDREYHNEASSFLKNIEFAKSIVPKTLQPLVIENMGSGINSAYSEFHPLLTHDGKTMVINSRKRGFNDEKIFDDGEFKEKIFISKRQEDGNWSRAIPIKLNEGKVRDNDFVAIQLLGKESKLLLYKIVKETAHLYLSDYEDGSFRVPYQIPIEPDPRFFSGDIIFSEDLKSCIFTMDGKTNTFQNDLFTSRFDEKSGNWTEPVSLGKNINTNREEGSPFLIGDTILYYSSRKENGLGEFDIYRSLKDKKGKWGPPQNLGFPFNTANNDFYYYKSPADTSITYISSLRGSTKGLSDIYRIYRTAVASGEGRILDENGNPLSNRSLIFEDPENYQNIPVKTDSEGKFKGNFVAGVNYQISISKADKFFEAYFKIPFPLQASGSTEIRLKQRMLVKPELPQESIE